MLRVFRGSLLVKTEFLNRELLESGLVERHNVRAISWRLSLSDGDHRLVQPLCVGVGTVGDDMPSPYSAD